MKKRAERLSSSKKSFQLPHVFVLLTCIAIIVAVMTWFVPAGEYGRVLDPASGRTIVDASDFRYIEKAPITLITFLSSYSDAFVNASSIIFMCFVVGGTFGIVNKLGILPAVLSTALKKFQKQKNLAIPVIVLALALFDSFMGAPELCIVFLPLILPVILALGYDSMTACAVVICGNCVGYSTGMGNPFTTIIAQKICELPLYSGFTYRAVCFLVFYLITVAYIMCYAKKVEKNPQLSRTYKIDLERREQDLQIQQEKLSPRIQLAGYFALACFLFNIYGVIRLKWDVPQMTGLFLVMSAGCGVISGHTLTETCKMFVEGAKDILQGALVMCFARTITILMSKSNTIDVLVHKLAGFASAFPPVLSIVGIFLIAMIVNFPIPSGSGEATVLMPLLSPLADILKVTKQSTVLAFQFGDGWTNTIYPTNASYMATLAVSGVSWTDWLSFQFPLCMIWTGASAVMLVIAELIPIGPF